MRTRSSRGLICAAAMLAAGCSSPTGPSDAGETPVLTTRGSDPRCTTVEWKSLETGVRQWLCGGGQ